MGLALGLDGNLYVADSGNLRVSVFTKAGQYVKKWGAAISIPYQMRFDALGHLWELDAGTGLLQVFNIYGDLLGQYGGSGVGQFVNPNGFDFDLTGGFYCADYVGNRVVKYMPCGSVFTPTPTPTSVPGAYHLRLDIGFSQTYPDQKDNLWIADQAYYSGSFGYTQGGQAVTSSVSVTETQDPALYQTYRKGSALNYRFDLETGRYQVTLKFADFISTASGQNILNLVSQGVTVIPSLDIYNQTGGAAALDRSFRVNVSSGSPLLVQLNALNGQAQLSAIEIEGLQTDLISHLLNLFSPSGPSLLP